MDAQGDLQPDENIDTDGLFYDIRWHLFQEQLALDARKAEYGELMMDDRYLTDFSLPWRGIPDVDPPRWLSEEAHEYRERQKTVATSYTIGTGPTRVSATDTSNIIQIWSSEGAITIQRSDLPELIGVLQRLTTGPTSPGAMNTASTNQRSKPLSQNEKVALQERNHRAARGW